jgi:hypothetical protein
MGYAQKGRFSRGPFTHGWRSSDLQTAHAQGLASPHFAAVKFNWAAIYRYCTAGIFDPTERPVDVIGTAHSLKHPSSSGPSLLLGLNPEPALAHVRDKPFAASSTPLSDVVPFDFLQNVSRIDRKLAAAARGRGPAQVRPKRDL